MTAVLLAVGLVLAAPQDDARSATASIGGTVREAASRAVIPNARVTLSGPGVRESTTTDGAGRFVLTGLAPGRYTLVADKESFAFDPAMAPPIVVAAGQAIAATIEMYRAAVIVGEVRDEQGSPRGDVAVHVLRRVKSGGTAALPGAPPRTNDLGEFRVDRVLPGDYLVLAAPPETAVTARALMPTYYPATTEQQAAEAVTVGPGDTTSVLITMQSAPAYEITGSVVDEQGRPQRAMIAFVWQAVQTWVPGQSASMRARVRALSTRADGTFRITGLGPGTYRLTPMPAPAAPPQQLPTNVMTAALNGNRSTVNVDVRDADVRGVTLVLLTSP